MPEVRIDFEHNDFQIFGTVYVEGRCSGSNSYDDPREFIIQKLSFKDVEITKDFSKEEWEFLGLTADKQCLDNKDRFSDVIEWHIRENHMETLEEQATACYDY